MKATSSDVALSQAKPTMEVSTATNIKPEEQDDSSNVAFYVYIVLGVLGMIGNAFVCVVMMRYRSVFNSTTNKLIIHQSMVDFLGSFVFILGRTLLITSPEKVPDSILGSVYCKLWWSEFPQYGMLITSTYNLAAISLERYLATCKPVKHRNMFSSNRQLKLIIATVWICGWLPEFHLLPVAYQVAGTCDAIWPSPTFQALAGFLIFIAEFSLPLAIIIFAYTKIILELYKRSKARVGDANQARNMLSKANKNVTKTLLVVAISYIICWTPTEVDYLLYNLELNNNFVDASIWRGIVLLNVCINPFIYCFTYERFQKQLKKMVCGGCQRNRINHVDTTSGSLRQAANTQHTELVSVISASHNCAEP